MYTWMLFVMFALATPFSDVEPQQSEDLQSLESTAVLQDDGGEVEPMCCGPNEPPPPPDAGQ